MDYDFLSEKMTDLYYSVKLAQNISSLDRLKESLRNKGNIIKKIKPDFQKLDAGKYVNEFIGKLDIIANGFNDLVENFDDKLMIFIVGNGCTGKSTLLNALVGYEIAKTDELPNTWKIDVYTPSIPNNKALIKYAKAKNNSFLFRRLLI